MAPADLPSVPAVGVSTPPAAPAAPAGTNTGGAGAPPLPVALGDQADIRPLDIPHALQILIAEVRAAIETALLQAVAPAPASTAAEALPEATLPGATPTEATVLEAALLAAAGVPAPDADLSAPPAEVPPPAAGAPLPTSPGPAAPPATGTAPGIAAELTTLLQQTLPLGGLALPAALGPLSPTPLTPPEAAHQVVALLLQALPPETADDAPLALRLPALLAALDSASAQALAIVSSWRDVPVATRDAAQSATLLIANVFSEEPLQLIWLRPEWAGFLPRLEQFRRRRRRLRRRLEDPDARHLPHADEERR